MLFVSEKCFIFSTSLSLKFYCFYIYCDNMHIISSWTADLHEGQFIGVRVSRIYRTEIGNNHEFVTSTRTDESKCRENSSLTSSQILMCLLKTDTSPKAHLMCVSACIRLRRQNFVNFILFHLRVSSAWTAVKFHSIPHITASTSDGLIKILNKRIKQMLHKAICAVWAKLHWHY